jgi:mannan endo-1,4-beta-mannosidase
MDVYVQEFGVKKTHDEFYTNIKIRKEFNKYLRFIVSRYANEPGIIAWELANDARCSSTLPSSGLCNTNTVTRWHAETAKFIRSIDPNHLITSGYLSVLSPADDTLSSHLHQGPWLLLPIMPQVILASASNTTFACPPECS